MSKGSIAPHEHAEIRLVLCGSKPLATIEKSKDPLGYALAISMASAGSLYYDIVAPGEVAVTLHKNKHKVKYFQLLLKHGVAMFGLDGYHLEMGKLYGYRDEDVRAFIKAELCCQCNKCLGISAV